MSVSVAPHKFKPLRPWDVRSGGRCRRCYLPMNAHPIHYWAPARPLGDKRKAELSWEALHGRSVPDPQPPAPEEVLLDEACSCLDETGGRTVTLWERCQRCGSFMPHEQPPAPEASEDAPRAWLVHWQDASRDEMLAWFQSTRRSGSAPDEGTEVVAASDYDDLAARLREESKMKWSARKGRQEAESRVVELEEALRAFSDLNCFEPNEEGFSVCEGTCPTCKARALLGSGEGQEPA